jgi:hypothetical protein
MYFTPASADLFGILSPGRRDGRRDFYSVP